jgi:hypothetical protein
MTEQFPGYSSEQPATPDAERIARLEAALTEAQEQRREAEGSAHKLRLWQWAVNTAMSSPLPENSVGANHCWRDLRARDGAEVSVLGYLQDGTWSWSLSRDDENAAENQQFQIFDLHTDDPGEVTVTLRPEDEWTRGMELSPEVVEALYLQVKDGVPLGPTAYRNDARFK